MLTDINPRLGSMLTDRGVLLLGSLLLCLFLYRIRRVTQVWQAFGELPTFTIVVSPLNFITRVLPRIPRISDGPDFSWRNVYERQPLPGVRFSSPAHSPCLGIFAANKSDIVHLRSLVARHTPQLLVADATAAKVGRSINDRPCAQSSSLDYLSEPYGIS